jgi:hypothetical protein
MANNKEQEVLREIDEQFQFAKRYLDNVHERMNEQEELYRTYIDSANYPHGAKVFDPRTFRVIETITPKMVANEPTGSFYPMEGGDVATAEILNALIRYDWRRAKMFPKLVNFVKSMLIFGTAFGRCYWDFRECERTRMEPTKVNGRVVWTPKNTKKVKYTEFDGPNFEVLNIYDCFPDPNATSMENMRWFIYRTFKTLKELEAENETRGTEYYKNLDVLKEAVANSKENKTGDARPDHLEYREHRRVMLSTEELHGQDDSNPEFVVLRRFTKDGWVDIVPEYNTVIREVENPYFHGKMPIVYGVDYPYPGELYGMGEIEPIDRIQRAINAVLNQRLDNVQLTLRSMWKVRKNSGVDLHTLVSAPGNIITTNDMSAVEPVQVPDVTGGTFVQTMNYLTAALQNGSGITDYTIGIDNKSNVANKTATGTRLVQQEANSQFRLKIQLFSHMVIQEIANQWKDLRIQYTTEEQKLRIIGSDEVKYLLNNTSLAKTPLYPEVDGEAVAPGDMETPTKLNVSSDQSFAFLTLIPDDIQPSIVGDYDFIATVSQDQLNDPIAMMENYFAAVDKVKDPAWTQGLATQGKQLNYIGMTEKIFDKLKLGLEGKDVLVDFKPPEQQVQPQPFNKQQLFDMAAPMENPLPNPLEEQNGTPTV